MTAPTRARSGGAKGQGARVDCTGEAQGASVELCRLTIPFDVGRLSPNRKMHWAARREIREPAKVLALKAWREAGEPRAHGPVRVSLVVRRWPAMDEDNIVAAIKPLADSLFNQAITPSDAAEWVSWGEVRQEVDLAYRGRAEVVFVVEVPPTHADEAQGALLAVPIVPETPVPKSRAAWATTDGRHTHNGCGGEVRLRPVGSAVRMVCAGCSAEWWKPATGAGWKLIK